jgi:hypothetical protein
MCLGTPSTRSARPLEVAQIFNLPYRRFGTCTGHRISRARAGIPRVADCKSAIQQVANLRYIRAALPPSASGNHGKKMRHGVAADLYGALIAPT